VASEVELALEGLVDRLDDLSQWLEQAGLYAVACRHAQSSGSQAWSRSSSCGSPSSCRESTEMRWYR
jgi:hypothetical protein